MPSSNRSQFPLMAPHGIYPTASEPAGIDGLGETDNWVALACRSDEDWRALADEIDAEWARDPRFATRDGRVEHQDELDAHIGRWSATRGRWELAAALKARDIPAAAVARPAERIDGDPNTADWGLWPTVTHQAMGEVRVDGLPGAPVGDGLDDDPGRPLPRPGQRRGLRQAAGPLGRRDRRAAGRRRHLMGPIGLDLMGPDLMGSI